MGFTTANLEKADEYRKENMMEMTSLWHTTIEQIGEYGVGLELYFTFLRDIAILFLIISLISIYPMVSNRSGDYMDAEKDTSFLDFYTMANQSGLDVGEISMTHAEDELDDLDKR